MLSFNHYAYGAMIDWVYRTVAGLAPADPGYRVVRVAPRPAAGMDRAAATIDTAYGPLAIDWRLEDGELVARLEIPFGVTAELDLPVTDASVASATGPLAHGVHDLRVTSPAIAG